MGLMFFSYLLLAALSFPDGTATHPSAPVLLPVEVLGEEGTVIDRTVYVSDEKSESVRFLWLRVHGVRYPAQASVQINRNSWIPLRNDTVDVAEPGKSFGGIGGGFATLELSLPISAGTVNAGVNVVRFRFNRSDGLASGYRILALNFLTAARSEILPPTDFEEDAPESWKPPHSDSASIRAGQELWLNAPLVANSQLHSPQIQAHCADCHAHDGRDLKYFNFSNASIIARSRFHGLSALQGEQIASYIRSLPFPNPGRPWNPPYQPGPGLDAKPIVDWAAGAGLQWVLDNDVKGLPFLLDVRRRRSASPESADESDPRSLVGQITSNVFHPDGDLNGREIPIALQLPDWSQWLPHVHPKDAWGSEFTESEFAAQYDDDVGRGKKTRRMPSLRKLLLVGASRDVPSMESAFSRWSRARRTFLGRYVKARVGWSPELVEKVYSAQLWQLMKTWEMMQEFQLEAKGTQLEGHGEESRIWCNTIPAETAPAVVHIPNGPNGVGGTALTNEYQSASWYELQIILSSGRHRHHDRDPVDWVYVIGHFHDLYALSQQPEPVRLLVAVTKAFQSTDPHKGPDDISEGWRPDQGVDPRIMISPKWQPMFKPFPIVVRGALTESLLSAWLDKNMQYPVTRYLPLPTVQHDYKPRDSYRDITGGGVWSAAGDFRAAGVSAEVVDRLLKWGVAYTDRAARIQYH